MADRAAIASAADPTPPPTRPRRAAADAGDHTIAPARPASRATVLFALSSLALGVWCYWPVLGGRFYADDWQFALHDPARHILRAFVERHPYDLYRPLQLSLVAVAQAAFGDTTVPIHLLQLVLHCALAVLVFRVSERLGAGRAGALVAGLFCLVGQAGVSSVGGNDTLSLTLGTLAGSTALWWLYRGRAEGSRRLLWAAGLAYAVALLAKESSVGYLPVLCRLSMRAPGAPTRRAPGGDVLLAPALVLLTVAYVVWRQHLGAAEPHFGGAPRDFHLGLNVVRNAGLLWTVAVLPLSSVRVLEGVTAHRWAWPAAGALATLALGAAATWGVLRGGRARAAMLCVVWGASAVAPVLVLNHVGELYAYALVPFVALILGWAATGLAAPGGRWRRAAVLAAAAVLVLSHAVATREKAQAMGESGRVAERMLAQVVAAARRMPAGAEIVLADPLAAAPEYSVFGVRGFRLVNDAPIPELAGRPDLSVRYARTAADLPDPGPSRVYLTLDARGRPIEARGDSLVGARRRLAPAGALLPGL